MAVYVMLAFKDDEAAKRYVTKALDTLVDENKVYDAEVYGVWKKPTIFCTCNDGGKRSGGYSRSKKYGWWVHAACAKPTRMWAQGENFYIDLGTNLLPREVHPNGKEFITKFRSEAEWRFLLSKD